MAYCTQGGLLKLISLADLAQLTAESGDTPDAAVITDAIAKADAEIDAYCGVRYQVPFAPVPEMVRSLSADMALYHLHTRRGLGLKAASQEVRRQKYEDALAFLKAVSRGQAVILGAAGVEEPGQAQDVVEVSSAARVFSRDSLNDW
jgi:phage gp36-like protein